MITSVIAAPDPQVWKLLLDCAPVKSSHVEIALQREELGADAAAIRSRDFDAVLL